ncbi:MAG: hypothetical protein ABMA02_00200 [Saprospiraceae bacterium]
MKKTSASHSKPFQCGPARVPSSPRCFRINGMALLVWITLIFLLPQRSFSQNEFCGSSEALELLLAHNPDIIQIIEEQNNVLNNIGQGKSSKGIVHQIPVVFHVIHLGEQVGQGSNISDAQLLQSLSDLNTYFRNTTTGTFDQVQYCVPIDITIVPCQLPDNCVAAWTPKHMSCTRTENGEYIFNIKKQVYAGPYSLCGGGLFGTVDSGYVTINGTPTVFFSVFTFDIDIHIPISKFVNGGPTTSNCTFATTSTTLCATIFRSC